MTLRAADITTTERIYEFSGEEIEKRLEIEGNVHMVTQTGMNAWQVLTRERGE